ncbi:hypothetical protein FRC12_000348 [Ceratobasidium sp. 428]|nr:hypothetical protein FRC12_000348 [Ceratobasidium sp. 428]
MKPPETDLRTDAFPHDYYPDHWGPFPIHQLFSMKNQLVPLKANHFYICAITPRNPHPAFLGFDDFMLAWPSDRDLPDDIITRRNKIRNSAEFRALVYVQHSKTLTADGIEQLKNAGADVSEAACREGRLVVAVTGKYENNLDYDPNRSRDSGVLFVRYTHEHNPNNPLSQHQRQMSEHKLRIVSMDMRTPSRCMLYFERVKLRCFMVTTYEENCEAVPVDDRDIKWFVQKYMQKHPFAQTAPWKSQGYRGARKHTSEVWHCFVCHAEWLLYDSGVSYGLDPVIGHQVLVQWAADAPAKREGAASSDRCGWGTWEVQWDNCLTSVREDKVRLKYHLQRLRQGMEENDSGNEGGDEDDGDAYDGDEDDEDAYGVASSDGYHGSIRSPKRQRFNLRLSSPSPGMDYRSSLSLGMDCRSSPSLGDRANPPPTELSSQKQIDFIVLSSDHESLAGNDNRPVFEILSSSDEEMRDPSDRGEGPSVNPLSKHTSHALRRPPRFVGPNLRANRSDDEESVRESDMETIARSSDSDTKYKRQDSPLVDSPEVAEKKRRGELCTWMLQFVPDVFFQSGD